MHVTLIVTVSTSSKSTVKQRPQAIILRLMIGGMCFHCMLDYVQVVVQNLKMNFLNRYFV